jgi:uncharacterized protein YecE (DUF72 family)
MNFGSGYFDSYDRYQEELFVGHKVDDSFKLSLGLPQWGEKRWKGILYPKDLAEKDFLRTYAQILDCVEVSSTFYAPVSKERMATWAKSVSDTFRFVVKWPKVITHDRSLIHCSDLMTAFLESLEGLENKLGATLLQLPPNFSKSSHRELYYFLISLPREIPLTLEFRHDSWFEQGRLYPRLFDFLQKNDWGMAVSDTPKGGAVFHQSFPGSINILRYLSDGNSRSDELRLKYWKDQLLQKKPGKDFYVMFHQEENDNTPALLDFFDQEWREKVKKNRDNQQQRLF